MALHGINTILFLNSLIRKSLTVTFVWICVPNYHKTLALISQGIIDHLRSHIKHSKVCFITYSNALKSFKKPQLHLNFSTYFSVFGYLMQHALFCLINYYIILILVQKPCLSTYMMYCSNYVALFIGWVKYLYCTYRN